MSAIIKVSSTVFTLFFC